MSARAYRVGPRRRAAGGPATRIRWDRLGRIVLVLVLFAILVAYVNPAVNFFDAWRGSHAERSQLQALSREHSRLAARVASLKRPGATVEAARRLGMIASGERAYVVQKLGH